MLLLSPDVVTLAAEASSAEETGLRLFLTAVFLLAGPLYYAAVYGRYRNAGKRHDHRRDTRSAAVDVRASDTLVRHRTGLKNKTMAGTNHDT